MVTLDVFLTNTGAASLVQHDDGSLALVDHEPRTTAGRARAPQGPAPEIVGALIGALAVVWLAIGIFGGAA